MPSNALRIWRTDCARALDEIEAAHRAVGGRGPGRRVATLQLNFAYVVMLASQFQRYCRDLHSEAADVFTRPLGGADPRLPIFLETLTDGRKLDSGNANSANIGSDFNRFGLDFWSILSQQFPKRIALRQHLDELNRWRNAIAHQSFDPLRLGGRVTLRLNDVRRWRSVCNLLANSFDAVIASHLRRIMGHKPW